MAEEHIVSTGAIRATTLQKIVKKRVDVIYRKSFLMDWFRRKKCITMNHGGDFIDWRPKIRVRTINPITGIGDATSFSSIQKFRKATLPWRGYEMGIAIPKFARLANKGPEQLRNLIADEMNTAIDEFIDDLRLRLYYDGYAAATAEDLMGLESSCGNTGSCVTNSKVVDPSDTYANLTTVLGGLGGTWSPPSGYGFPDGTGNTRYCAWSPLIVDYTNTGFTPSSGSTYSWKYLWQEVTNYMETFMNVLHGVRPELYLLNPRMLMEAQNSLVAIQGFELTTKKGDSADPGVSSLSYNGIEYASEYGVPEVSGYALISDHIELMSMQNDLVVTEKDRDIDTSVDKIKLDAYLQLRLDSPAYLGKFEAVGGAGT